MVNKDTWDTPHQCNDFLLIVHPFLPGGSLFLSQNAVNNYYEWLHLIVHHSMILSSLDSWNVSRNDDIFVLPNSTVVKDWIGLTQFTWHDANFSQSPTLTARCEIKMLYMNTTHLLGLVWCFPDHVMTCIELRKSSHHIHHMPNMSAMVAPRNMFGWVSYLDLEVICTAHIGA